MVQLCHELLGLGTLQFSTGADGGRDAFFEGRAARYPSPQEPWSGKLVIQAKHTGKADASCSDNDFVRTLLTGAKEKKSEAEKIAALHEEGKCDAYLLFTNRMLLAQQADKLVDELRQETGVERVAILGGETVSSYLDAFPEIARRFGLQTERAVGAEQVAPLPHEERLDEVERVVASNYEELDEKQRQQWRSLAVFAGDFDLAAAAAVWAIETRQAQSILDRELYRVRLVECRAGRYRLHDLARDFAAAQLEVQEQRIAEQRHAGHYVQVLADVNRRYRDSNVRSSDGKSLFDLEARNILAGQAWAAAYAADDSEATRYCNAYPSAGSYCLGLLLHPRDRGSWLKAGLSAAMTLGDRRAEGRHLGALGGVYSDLCRPGHAIELCDEALKIAREIADRQAEGDHLGALGIAHKDLGQPIRAIDFFEQHLKIAREIGDRRGEGNALGNLGVAYAALSEPRRAIEYYRQVLEIVRETGDRRGEDGALANLGSAYAALGKPRRAIEFYEQALVISREIGDRRGEGLKLGNLGVAYKDLGESRRAIELHERALEINREIGNRRGEGRNLGNLGLAYAALGEPRRAIELYEQRLEIAREFGDRRGEVNGLSNLGSAFTSLGSPRRAIELHEQALAIAREIGDRRGQGSSLGHLGIAYAEMRSPRRAIEFHQQQLEIAREIGDRSGEGSALGSLGNAYADLGKSRVAVNFYEQRLEIAQEIGDRQGQGHALGNLGIVYAELGESRRAIEYYEQRLEIAREIGDRSGEALGSWRLGMQYEKQGDFKQAVKLMMVTVDYRRKVGHPDAEKDAARVDEIRARQTGDGSVKRVLRRLRALLSGVS